jgi:hypothetical protein
VGRELLSDIIAHIRAHSFLSCEGAQLMYEDESRSGQRRARQEDQFEDALQLGPRKKPYVSLTSPVKTYGYIADQL